MTDSERQIGFEQLGIGSVLSRHSLFVPPNQREFSWTEREVQALFHDFHKAIADSDKSQGYFLGSIVTIPRKLGELEVVDGQQRLATTAILLAAIRDALKGRDADKLIVDDIEHKFLTTIDRIARERVPRLRLNVTDGNFFKIRLVEGDIAARKTASSHILIDNAFKYANEHVSQLLKGFSDKDYGDILNKWVEFIEHKAIVILLKVPSAVNAYKMFETLNDRGLRTSQSDLVKNYLFGESGGRLPEAQQKWTAMKSLLESVDDEDITVNFLRQLLISSHGYLREPDVYETVQRNAKGSSSSIQFMTNLETGASDYAAMLNPEHEKWNRYSTSTRRAIRTLILLKMRPMRPLILSVIRSFNIKEVDNALKMIVNIVVRYLIAGGARTGSVEQTLAAAAKDVSGNKIKTSKDLLDTIYGVIPKDTQFQEAFNSATVSQAYLARYYLRSLEMAIKKEPEPSFIPNEDQQAINLEHIFPENPGDNWPSFAPEVGMTHYKRLGNMALLAAKKNSDLRSAPFSEKKKAYSESAFELTHQIAKSENWTPETITQRQSIMAKLAVKTWPASSG